MKIIDSFIFYNELDLLEYRLSILNEYVDYFILVESSYTFTGKPKKLYYQENKDIFDKFNHKIIHIKVTDFPYKYPNIDYTLRHQNINENFQRDCIKRGINKLANNITINDNDLLLFSDVDEIPNPTFLNKIKNKIFHFDTNIFYRLELDMYYYNLNVRLGDGNNWHGIKLITFEFLKNNKLTFQEIRNYEHIHDVPIIKNGGWHLSYFGDSKFIYNKLENFKEMESQHYRAYTKYNEQSITNAIKDKINILGGLDLQYIKIKDNVNLPPKYEIYLKQYYN